MDIHPHRRIFISEIVRQFSIWHQVKPHQSHVLASFPSVLSFATVPSSPRCHGPFPTPALAPSTPPDRKSASSASKTVDSSRLASPPWPLPLLSADRLQRPG